MENTAGFQTEKNLQTAFADESQARNKYTCFASKARKEAMNRLRTSLRKQQETKKNMQKSG